MDSNSVPKIEQHPKPGLPQKRYRRRVSFVECELSEAERPDGNYNFFSYEKDMRFISGPTINEVGGVPIHLCPKEAWVYAGIFPCVIQTQTEEY